MPSATNIVFDPILPVPVIVLLALVMAVLTVRLYLRVGTAIGRWQNGALLVFRLAGIIVILLLLLQPSRVEKIPPPTQNRVTLLALDTSLSMKQRDVNGATRYEAARNILLESEALPKSGLPEDPRVRLFEFGEDTRPVNTSVFDLASHDKTTHFHKSVVTALSTLARNEAANALILLTDGHDFELMNPAKTGAAARSRQTPIYAVPIGKQGKVRDVSARITSFQPYCYVKQQARITAGLRLIGCEYEQLNVQLLRQGQVVQTKRLNADEFQELPVEFEVIEPETGQYEYEVRVQPLDHEVDNDNNSAITYLNVIDQQIRVLILEGDPYWDTTFLQRSLMRNDKFEVDSLVSYGRSKFRAIRKAENAGELVVPTTAEEFNHYDVIILGRAVDSLLNSRQIDGLTQCVKDLGGTVIFSRGPAFANGGTGSELEPVIWGQSTGRDLRLEATAEGRNASALQSLNQNAGGLEELPEVLSVQEAKETKPLTSTLALAADRYGGKPVPALVHRRYGRGQVVSIAVAGLWRWGLNAKVEGANTPFDRFWDQTILWLLAGRDFIPSAQFSFRTSSANILLGEKIYFRLVLRRPDPSVKSVPLTIYYRDQEAGRANLMGTPGDSTRLVAEFLPTQLGRYRVEAKFPDGTRQESRFIVFTENFEETEVATDVAYLRRLCETSGGRLLNQDELKQLMVELGNQTADLTPKTRLCPIWNETWVFYLAGLLFGVDWFLRRRWGLC